MRVKAIPLYATLLPVDALQDAIHSALDETGKVMDEKFGRTTAAWTGESPEMKHEVEMGTEAAVSSGPRGRESAVEKWVRLDVGVNPRRIYARKGKYMRFPFQGVGRSYRASTFPRQFRSGYRAKLGPVSRFQMVNHPGHEGREWSGEMAEQEAGPMTARIQREIDRALF